MSKFFPPCPKYNETYKCDGYLVPKGVDVSLPDKGVWHITWGCTNKTCGYN